MRAHALADRYSVCAFAAAAFFSSLAQATNGYLMDGYGVKSLGIAGAGIALPQDALAAATNPAGTALIGNRFDIGITLFAPEYGADIHGNGFGADGHYGGSTKKFLIPELGYSHALSDSLAAGVALYGNGGMTTEYHQNPFGAFGAQGRAGVNLSQLFITPSLAWSPIATQAFGLALNVAYQRFSAEGLNVFATSSIAPADLTDRGTDTSTGVGAKLGWTGQIIGGLSAGASWSSKIKASKFKDYSGLFADSGSFDIPETFAIGLSYKVVPGLTLAADGQRIQYGAVRAIANPLSNLFAGNPLGSADGPGFGWRDITVLKLGAVYDLSKEWTLRAGYSHSGQPIPSDQTFFNILAPGVISDHVSAGATWRLTSRGELSLAYTYAVKQTVRGSNSIPPNFAGGNANIFLSENIFSVAYGWKL
jgi:long-chain fatty acid transport protein